MASNEPTDDKKNRRNYIYAASDDKQQTFIEKRWKSRIIDFDREFGKSEISRLVIGRALGGRPRAWVQQGPFEINYSMTLSGTLTTNIIMIGEPDNLFYPQNMFSSAETIKAEMNSPMKNPFFKLSQKWFNDPTFVDLFEYEDRIFLVFQEKIDDNNLGVERRKCIAYGKTFVKVIFNGWIEAYT